jgi:hypothetical protein
MLNEIRGLWMIYVLFMDAVSAANVMSRYRYCAVDTLFQLQMLCNVEYATN